MTTRALEPSGTREHQAPHGGIDVSGLLGLQTRAAQLVLGVFILSNVVFTFGTAGLLDHAWASYLAMIVVSAGGILILRPHPDPYPLRYALTVIAAIVVSCLLVSYALPDTGALGRATWHIGSDTWLLWFLILRRRAWLAWVGTALMVAITVMWAIASGRGVGTAIALLQTQLGLLVVATLFAVALRRTAARINELTERSVSAAARAASTDAAQELRRQRAEELATHAVPLLDRIASGVDLVEADRHEFARIEAQLRDSVRGRSLAVPHVLAAVARARDRGLEVTLLDDRGAPLSAGSAMIAIETAIATALDAAVEGEVTVRLLPPDRDVALTVVNRRGDETTRLALTGDGAVSV